MTAVSVEPVARPLTRQAHVALYAPSMRGGGAERVMLNLANQLAGRGLDVDLVLVKAEGGYLDKLSANVRVVDLDAKRSLYALPGLIKYLRRARPDALLATMPHIITTAVLARQLAGVRTRIVAREASTRIGSKTPPKSPLHWLRRRLTKAYYVKADAIIAPSADVAKSIESWFGLEPQDIHIIHNPVVSETLFEQAKEALEHPWFGPDQPPLVLAVGRLTEAKDYPTLLNAFAKLSTTTPARLLILGEGALRAQLETQVKALGLDDRVQLPGFVDNPFAYMARADLYVLSSAWEGLPNALIQALALGAPVVATDCRGGAADILEQGRYGRLVPVGDDGALAEAMRLALSRPLARVSEAWLETYSVDHVTEQFLERLLPTGS